MNPESTEIIELGTQQFPYKNIGSVFVELLNIRSHSEDDITIFLMENTVVDIEKGYNYVSNISSVKIESYGASSSPSRATLYVRHYEVEIFNSKTRFNLVTDRTLSLSPVINVPEATDSEKSVLQSTDT